MFKIVSQKNKKESAFVDIKNIVDPTPISLASLVGVFETPQQTKQTPLPIESLMMPNYSSSSFLG